MIKAPNKVMNCIVVFNKEKDKVLFCKRKKDPFKDCLNFVGGKVESGESSGEKLPIGNWRKRLASTGSRFVSTD